jgi:hypothetical protein
VPHCGNAGLRHPGHSLQPAGNEIAAPLSPEVADAVDTVVLCLLRLLARDWVRGSTRGELIGQPVVERNCSPSRRLGSGFGQKSVELPNMAGDFNRVPSLREGKVSRNDKGKMS